MKILAIGAHPDDIEFGCGGTLAKYHAQGAKSYLLVMTRGEAGGEREVRQKEQEESLRLLGGETVAFAGYRDTRIPLDKEVIGRIEEVLQKTQPDMIFVHHPEDTHQDHRTVAAATVSATRNARNVLFYEGPTSEHFTPTVFVDISSHLETKVASLQAHASQVMKTNIDGLSIVEIARAAATFRGIQARVKQAEGFVPLRLLLKG
jgi:LmbE family N-acetylglucosaminyl deacetylase